MSLRSRILGFGSALLLVVLGVAGGVGFGGTFGQVLALVLVSLGLVQATALVFYEVGLSEDRERAREAARRERDQERWDQPRGPRFGLGSRRGRRGLERRRGQRRRLG